MHAAEQQRAPARRRTPGGTGDGADVGTRPEQVQDLVRVSDEPVPWVARKHGSDRIFRGRLLAGTAVLPPRIAPTSHDAITVGLASRPLVLRSVGVAHHVPANVPWVVLPDAEWRITVTEATDLRLVLTHEVSPVLVAGAMTSNRPVRLEGREAKIARAAIRSATPVWVDALTEPVKDLAVTPQPGWSLVGQDLEVADRDQYTAFLLMMTWAFDQRTTLGNPRLGAVTEYIRSRLSDPALTTTAIAEQLRISRRSLQSLYESEGGVAAYIRRQRIAAALRLLTADPARMPDLDTVATRTGLGSRRTLERAMRQVYGLTPRQARSHLLAGHPLHERSDQLERSATTSANASSAVRTGPSGRAPSSSFASVARPAT